MANPPQIAIRDANRNIVEFEPNLDPAKGAKQDEARDQLVAILAKLGLGINLSAGESHVGAIGGNTSYVDVTLVVNTSIYASGDVLSDRVAIPDAMRINDETGVLQSVIVLDEGDQGAALDLVFLSADVSIGTVNAPVALTDANARNVLGIVNVEASDFIDLGDNRVATKWGLGITVKPATGTRIIYVAAISRGAPTFSAASNVKLRLGFLQD